MGIQLMHGVKMAGVAPRQAFSFLSPPCVMLLLAVIKGHTLKGRSDHGAD